MVAWPASLPQSQFIGATDQDDDSVLRTPMDSGPPTRRNRFTAITRSVRTPMTLDGTQKATFDTFYRTTIANGSLSFDWEDPASLATVSFAFKSPPVWTMLHLGTAAGRFWSTSLDLEIQP